MKGSEAPFGRASVPVLKREWPGAPCRPYRKAYSLKPGQSWHDAETGGQREYCALDCKGNQVPATAMVARELKAEGASEAAFVELWSGVTLVDEELICVDHSPCAGQLRSGNDHVETKRILSLVEAARGGSLKGFPDVIAVFPDGRIAVREVKRAGKDKVQEDQHEVADTLRDLFGQRLDLALVEWRCRE